MIKFEIDADGEKKELSKDTEKTILRNLFDGLG